jgi:hypothetical protein
MKLEFYRKMFKKSSNIKFHENPLSASRDVPCGRKYMTKLGIAFSQFCKRAKTTVGVAGGTRRIRGYVGGVSEYEINGHGDPLR